MAAWATGVVFAGLGAAGCDRSLDAGLEGPLCFDVAIVAGDAGTMENPLPFTSDPRVFRIDIAAVDLDGGPADWFEREVRIDVAANGQLTSHGSRTVSLSGGRAEGVEVSLEKLHGVSRIWVEDCGTEDEPGTFATGLSEPIVVRDPTIGGVQRTDKPLTSPLKGDFVRIDTEGRTLVVTGVSPNGFFVTDTSDPEGAWNAIYVYTFSWPTGVEQGSRIGTLSGTVDEFYGFTELVFPTWTVSAQGLDEPAPAEITAAMANDDLQMESYESRLVRVSDAIVCPPGEDYATYGQWAALLSPDGDCATGEGAVNVVTAYAAASFDPRDHVGQTLSSVKGNLRYHEFATPPWIINARRASDIVE